VIIQEKNKVYSLSRISTHKSNLNGRRLTSDQTDPGFTAMLDVTANACTRGWQHMTNEDRKKNTTIDCKTTQMVAGDG
jgi:hypothetical protein